MCPPKTSFTGYKENYGYHITKLFQVFVVNIDFYTFLLQQIIKKFQTIVLFLFFYLERKDINLLLPKCVSGFSHDNTRKY